MRPKSRLDASNQIYVLHGPEKLTEKYVLAWMNSGIGFGQERTSFSKNTGAPLYAILLTPWCSSDQS